MTSDHDLRVLVVAEDHLTRAGLAALLGEQGGCAVAGQVSPSEYESVGPDVFSADVVVWDTGWGAGTDSTFLPDDSHESGLPVVVLLPDDSAASEAWADGARGMLLRDVDGPRLATAVRAVADGMVVLGPGLSGAIAPQAAHGPELLADTDLTPREMEVLRLVADGLPNKAIAQRLSISEHTVKFYVNAVFGKLGAQSRTEAVARATRMGLITL